MPSRLLPASSALRVHVHESTLPRGISLEAAALASPDEFMLVDAVPVSGRASRILALFGLYRFEVRDGAVTCQDQAGEPVAMVPAADPLTRLMSMLSDISYSGEPLPPVLKSAFGFVAYEAARGFERLPERHPRIAPDYLFHIPRAMAVQDKESGQTRLVILACSAEEAREQAAAVRVALTKQAPADHGRLSVLAEPWLTRQEYMAAVGRAKEYLLDGDIFQVVLSLRLELAGQISPASLYRRLTTVNPSPFQFCYRGPEFAIVGASPEPFVTMAQGRVSVRPLAGTRPRGRTPDDDQRLERELRESLKDAAEHRMLVDLARNDIGRVCVPGTVEVDVVMQVERYSHVMHLVSNVVGQVAPGHGAGEVLRACFPAGTMAGAPKVRAMEIIEELEPAARGFYAGAVGLISPEELHTYLVIRSAVQRRGRLSLQAGAGIVADSDPEAEYAECLSKLAATADALGIPLPRSQ